jgi:predicted DNA-binding protein with PD1-like motif
MKSMSASPRKTIIARIDGGEDLLLSLQKIAEENGIRSGWFTVIGGLKKLAYGLFEHGNYHNIVKDAKKCCFELLPTCGNISIKEGKIFAHCHIIASDEEEGRAFGGHLLEGTIVYPTAEVYMQGCDAEITRTFDAETKFWPMKL